MNSFEFYSPTKIFFGKGREKEIGAIIKKYGYKKVLFHYGKNAIKKIGLYDQIITSLKANEIDYIEIDGVEPNPKIKHVRESIKICKQQQIDFILAVGGGSVIDSAKAIACGMMVEEDPWLFNTHDLSPNKAIPIGVILTISAAGSEMSNSCVITNNDGLFKRGFNSDLMRPIFVIMNPELTFSVSKMQTGCGIVDIIMHTLERYLCDNMNTELTLNIAEGLMKTVIEAGKIAIKDPYNYDARANLMLASSFSHNGLTGLGGKMYFTVHKLEHELSGMYDEVAHGVGLSILYPAWAKYTYTKLVERFARFSYNVMGIEKSNNLMEDAYKGIIALEEYFKSIGMPTSLSEINIDDRGFLEMAQKATNNDITPVKGIVDLDVAKIIEIFKIAK